jgi:hypothetical protein
MLMKRAAATLVAAFLLLATNGCYTHLKSRATKLVPDEPVVEQETVWDFDWGWIEPDYYNSTVYYDYYYVPWWDGCSWCDNDDETTSSGQSTIEPSPENGKITRRDEPDYLQPSVQVPPNNTYIPPSVVTETPPSPPSGQTVIQPSQPTEPSRDKKPAPVTDDSNNSNTKIKRAGRR